MQIHCIIITKASYIKTIILFGQLMSFRTTSNANHTWNNLETVALGLKYS